MKYAVSALPNIERKFNDATAANKAFNEMIRDGFSYVELKEIVSESPNYYTKSIKIFWK